MKVWVDDVREAPIGYVHIRAVDSAIDLLKTRLSEIEELNLDHDAGDYAIFGGDYIKILDYLEAQGINNIKIHVHSMNPVGVDNMRRIIERNHWTVV